MNKKLWAMMVLTLGLVLMLGGMADAKYFNMIGTWTGSTNDANWDGTTSSFPPSVPITLVVTNQDAHGMFYGTFTYDISEDSMTGSIDGNVITFCVTNNADAYGVFNGKYLGYNKISGTENWFGGNFISTSKFKLKKQP